MSSYLRGLAESLTDHRLLDAIAWQRGLTPEDMPPPVATCAGRLVDLRAAFVAEARRRGLVPPAALPPAAEFRGSYPSPAGPRMYVELS